MKFYWPVRNLGLPTTCNYSCHKRISPGYHAGHDIGMPVGTPILCTAGKYNGGPAVVEYAGWDKSGYGNLVVLDHKGGWKTWHGHLNVIKVKKGQKIYPGHIIGKSGNTGRSTGPHLHWGIQKGGVFVDPMAYIYKPRQAPPGNSPVDPPSPPKEKKVVACIDVSKHQGEMNWVKARSTGAEIAIIRSSTGIDYRDPKFEQNWQGAKNAGFMVTAYHNIAGQQGVNQLINLHDALEDKSPDLPVVMSVEYNDGASKAQYKKTFTDIAIALAKGDSINYSQRYWEWIEAMYNIHYSKYADYNIVGGEQIDRIASYPAIYTSDVLWRKLMGSFPPAAYCPLFVAHYTNGAPAVPSDWQGLYMLHQFSAGGNGLGPTYGAQSEDIDLSVWNDEFLWIGDFPKEPIEPPEFEWPEKFATAFDLPFGDVTYQCKLEGTLKENKLDEEDTQPTVTISATNIGL